MKTFLLYISIILSAFSAAAQPPPPGPMNPKREEKIQALYVAYITKELQLTSDEAEKFWPVHRQFDAELRGIDFNANELDRQQSVLNIKRKYQPGFTKILGPSRTNEFFRQDAEFRKKLVDRLRQMRQQRGNGGEGRPMPGRPPGRGPERQNSIPDDGQ